MRSDVSDRFVEEPLLRTEAGEAPMDEVGDEGMSGAEPGVK